MLPGISHHSKRPPSPATRDEEKRRALDDKWKSGTSDKLLHDRVTISSRGPTFDDPTIDPLLSKHSLSSRLSKSNRPPSLVRLKNPPEPPEPSLSKKRPKEKVVDKVSKLEVRGSRSFRMELF